MISSQLPAVSVVFADKADIPIQFSETLPDYLPDIRRIVGADCRTLHCTAAKENDRIRVIASGSVELIFVAEGKGHIKTAVFPFTLDKSFALPGGISDEPLHIGADGAVFVIGASLPAARTVEFRGNAVINVSAVRETLTELAAFDRDGVCLHETVLSPAVRRAYAEQFEKQEDIVLDADMPAIAELGQTRLSFGSVTCRRDGEKLVCGAELRLRTVYRAETETDEGDADYVYVTKSLPVSAELPTDLPDEVFPADSPILPRFDMIEGDASVSFDNYGENRIIRLSVRYTLSAECFGITKVCCYDDAFRPGHSYELTRGRHAFETIKTHFDEASKTSASVSADAAKIGVIHDAFLRLCGGTLENSDGKPVYAAKTVLTVTGADGSGMPVCLSSALTLRFPVPLTELLTPSDRAVIVAEPNECTAYVRAGEIIADISVSVRGVILTQQKVAAIDDIRVGDALSDGPRVSEYVFCYPGEAQKLWDIAKKYDVSPSAICRANGIEGDKIDAGHLLMIPRTL